MMIITTDEQLQGIVEEFIEHDAIWSTDDKGIIKIGDKITCEPS